MGQWGAAILGVCERVTKSSESAFQCCGEPNGVYAPEVVLSAVDEGDRNLVGEPFEEVWLSIDVDAHPVGPELRRYLRDHGQRLLAEVAVFTDVDHDPGIA